MNSNKFLVSLVINFIIAFVYITLFLIFRKRCPKIYEPRCDGSAGAPASPPAGLFGWISSTLKYSDETLFRTHGLDALMFVKFAKMMLVIVVFQFLFGWIILIPVNATAENTKLSPNDLLYTSGLSILSMSAIAIRSNRLWAPTISVIFNSLVIYYFSYTTYRQYMNYRLRHKVSRRNENFSVMITNVPENDGDEVRLRMYFEALFPNQVVNVVRARDNTELEKLFEKRGKSMRKMEGAYWVFNDKGKRIQNRNPKIVGKKVDSIDFYTQQFNGLENAIVEDQHKDHKLAGVVFVTFNSIKAAMQCSRLVLAPYDHYKTNCAPEPRDVLWRNLVITRYSHYIRTLIIMVAMFFLVVFWMVGVTFVASLANLSTLANVSAFHFLSHLKGDSPVITGFIEGYAPTLVLLIFNLLLAPILMFASRKQGHYTKSETDGSVMHKYHVFVVYNIFFIFSIAGSAFGVLESLIKDPSQIPNLLATSLPQQSTFFINYIMLLSLTVQSRALSRPNALLLVWFKKKFMAKSPRAIREVEHPGIFRYSIPTATHLLVFLIVTFYSTIAPFILLFGVVYFAMVYIVSRYNLIYVFEPEFEGGGYLWPGMFHRIMVATLIYQIALIGEFGLYRFAAGSVISGVMVFITIAFWVITYARFRQASTYGALCQLIRIPSEAPSGNVTMDVADDEVILNRLVYLQPTMLKPKPGPELPGQPADPEEDKHDPGMNYGIGPGVSSISTANSLMGGAGHA